MKVKFAAAFWLAACIAWLMVPAASHAQYVLADFQDNTGDGCVDWWAFGHNGYNASVASITNTVTTNAASANLPMYPNVYSFAAGAVPPYAQSLEINEAGYNQSLTLNLSYAQWQQFALNNQLSFTVSVPPGTGGGYSQIPQVVINCNGSLGYYGVPWNTTLWSVSGDTNNDYTGNQPNFYFYNGSPVQSQVVTLNYSSLLPQITNNGYGYLQIMFTFNNGGGAPTYCYMNRVVLTPWAGSVVYVEDDFATNGVNPANPTNYDYYATAYDYTAGDLPTVWGPWYGGGCSGVSFAPTVQDPFLTAPGHGAMAASLTWTGTSDQWLLWHNGCGNTLTLVPGGTTGIGYPQYTNLSCDVQFDPSSVTNANGVYGVIRLGILPGGGCGASWQNPGAYTTITDTNWHHMNMDLRSVTYGDIGSMIIGEDEAYLGGVFLTGAQTLYIADIKFTGPTVVAKIPPPTLAAPVPATPELRIFAGDAINTYDRQQLYTVDSSQSWVDPGVTYPVKYSYSLLDYNPNITQIHLELLPTSSAGQYTDYGGANTLWMVLNPGPAAGQVVCNVQWKTNFPNSNPGHTDLSFTNSTAVGKWSLVFTSPNNGYVEAPGQVINGPTNFTITDPNVVADWAEPVQVMFGHQPNSTAGEGAYIDYGMIRITGVVGVNEFEDFTKEGSDISANLTPSGEFNNNASYTPASTVIITTNDAPGGYWISWTSPAVGYTLASSTKLLPANWINPGWYGQYLDTNAPRVMPLPAPYASRFWVLLPKDDVPTANGLQNPAPPAATAPAPNAFYLVSTNVVSP